MNVLPSANVILTVASALPSVPTVNVAPVVPFLATVAFTRSVNVTRALLYTVATSPLSAALCSTPY